MRINISIDDLVAFTTLAQKLSYKTAAETLNASPSALSRRIQRLERTLDAKLFDRTTHEVRLTSAGQQLLNGSDNILADIEEMLFALRGEGLPRSRSIRAGCVPSATRVALLPALSKIVGQGTQAQVKVVDATAIELLDAVLRHEIDFAISYMGSAESGIEFLPLAVDPFVVALRGDHPLADRESIGWEELDGLRAITARHGAGNRTLMDVGLAKVGMRINWSFEVQHVNTALALVDEGLGVAVVPSICVVSANYSRIRGVPLAGPQVERTLGLIKRDDVQLRNVVSDLWTAIAAQFEPPAQLPGHMRLPRT